MYFIGFAIISIGLLFLSRLLYKPPKDASNGLGQDQPTTLATRGDYINFIIGTRRVGYNFGWAGERVSDTVGGGGGKGIGGGEVPGQKIWKENGWHQICKGPATKLWAIFSNNKAIWTGPISSDTTPSGTSFTIPDEGTFTIYWGGYLQPVNTFLGAPTRVGINSRWPDLCYVVWTDKVLGPTPMWPQMEYVVTVGCPGNKLRLSNYELNDGISVGVNAAHAMLQLLNADYPHGLGIPEEFIDDTTLEAFGIQNQAEHIPVNMLLQGGAEASRPIQSILQDMGWVMPQCQGRLTFLPIRQPITAVPVFGDDVITSDIERTIDRGDSPVNRIVFTFKNVSNGTAFFSYRDQDIVIDDDAEMTEIGLVSSQKVSLETVTFLTDAMKIARRRMQENSVKAVITVTGTRAARQLCAGQLFNRVGFGNLRVISVKRSDDSAECIIECTPDSYAVPDIADVYDAPVLSNQLLDVAADKEFRWVQLPSGIVGTSTAVAVFRVRDHQQIDGAQIYASGNGTNFYHVGDQDSAAAGGLLDDPITTSTTTTIVAGPIFVADNLDAANILDLSGDSHAWTTGKQVALIDDEVFYVESVTVQSETARADSTAYILGDFIIPATPTGLRYECTTAGTSAAAEPFMPLAAGDTVTDGTVVWTARHLRYQLNNMMRAQFGSTAATHAIGARVFVVEASKLQIIKDTIIVPSMTLDIKAVPTSSNGVVDIATVTAVSGAIP